MTTKLLQLRSEKKSRKPAFVTQDSWKRKEVPRAWRKPRGLHSKMRLKHRGNPKIPSQGYRSPREVRYLHPSGVKAVVVNSVKQLEVAKDAVIIASTVGIKKKLAMMKAATEKKLTVLNLSADYVSKVEAAFAEGKKARMEKQAAKAAKESKKSKEKKAAQKETEEDKRKTGKKEMEKIVTKAEK